MQRAHAVAHRLTDEATQLVPNVFSNSVADSISNLASDCGISHSVANLAPDTFTNQVSHGASN